MWVLCIEQVLILLVSLPNKVEGLVLQLLNRGLVVREELLQILLVLVRLFISRKEGAIFQIIFDPIIQIAAVEAFALVRSLQIFKERRLITKALEIITFR